MDRAASSARARSTDLQDLCERGSVENDAASPVSTEPPPLLLEDAHADVQELFTLIKNQNDTAGGKLHYLVKKEDFYVVDDEGHRRTILQYACGWKDKEKAVDIVKKILANFACYSSMGRTSLIDKVNGESKSAIHYALEQGNKKLVKLLLYKGADVNLPKKGAENEALKLIIEQMPEVLLFFFETSLKLESVEEEYFQQKRRVTWDFFPITTVLPHNLTEDSFLKFRDLESETSNIVKVLSQKDVIRSEVLFHPLYQLFSHFKYEAMRWFIRASVLFHVVWSIVCISFLVCHAQFPGMDTNTTTCNCSCSSSISNNRTGEVTETNWTETNFVPEKDEILANVTSSWNTLSLVIFWMFYAIMFIKELIELIISPNKAYYKHQVENVGQFLLLIPVMVVAYLPKTNSSTTIAAAIGIYLAGLLIVGQLNKLQSLGINIDMFAIVTWEILKLLAFFSPLILIHALKFHLMLPVKKEFGKGVVIPKVLTMMTGEATFNELFLGPEPVPYPGITLVEYACFVLTVILVLPNLLLLLTMSDLNILKVKAKEIHLAKQLELMYLLEEFILSPPIKWLFEECNLNNCLLHAMVDVAGSQSLHDLPEELREMIANALEKKPNRFQVQVKPDVSEKKAQ